MECILAQAGKVAEEAEVFQVSSEETQVRFEANRLKQLLTRQQTSVALRLIKKGRTGYATTTGIGDGHELVSNAVETAQFGAIASFQLPGLTDYPPVEIFDAAVDSVSVQGQTFWQAPQPTPWPAAIATRSTHGEERATSTSALTSVQEADDDSS